MAPRRSRFSRICRRLTRRAPNRQAQWQQIATLRGHGAPGHLARPARASVYVPEYEPPELPVDPPHRYHEPESVLTPVEDVRPAPDPAPTSTPGGSAALAALTASLFLLACAYAAFSGYMHSYDDGFASLGILGAVGSLLAAGIGVCLAASGLRRRYSGKFLTLCAITLAGMYAVLLLFAIGH